jgi:Polyketide cyclase / dehydrase and lipid transport
MKTRVIQDDAEPAENGINRSAPVVGTSETEVAAARDVVWDVLTGIEHWPSWNPDVRSVSMHGALSEGTVFRWKTGPGTITSTLEHVEVPRRVAWSGKAFGLKAMHVYALEARNGTTLVRTEESYDGLVARLFRARLQKTLDGALEIGLRHLKAEAERRTTAHLAAERRS